MLLLDQEGICASSGSACLADSDEPSHVPITAEVETLADAVLQSGSLPAAARSDAIHVAAATLAGVDFLLTWNCRHLANPHLQKQLRALMAKRGLTLPEICTPIELGGQ